MTLRGITDKVLDVLFPRRCPWCNRVVGFQAGCTCDKTRAALCLAPQPLAPRFEAKAQFFSPAWACFLYDEPVRGLIHRLKFEGEKDLAPLLADALARQFGALGLAGRYDVLIPAPSSPKTIKKRGYNQSALLAAGLGARVGMPCMQDGLRKVRETTPQMRLDREGRLNNLAGAFEADAAVAGKRILLVDDIITTGSTLNECANALRQAGAASCAALCVAAVEENAQKNT